MYTIQDFRARHIAIDARTATDKQIEQLFKMFPHTKAYEKRRNNYYIKSIWSGDEAVSGVETIATVWKIQKLEDFMEINKKEFKRGDIVYVSDFNEDPEGNTSVLFFYDEGAKHPFIVFDNKFAYTNYKNGESFGVSPFKYGRHKPEPQPIELTIDEIAAWKGVDPSLIKIKK